MARLVSSSAGKAGLPPGTLVHVGESRDAPVRITVIDYSAETFDERGVASVEDCVPFRDSDTVTWVNVDGVHDIGIVEQIGRCFGLHLLALEDVVDTGQRPKTEDYGDHLFSVVKMLYCDGDSDEVRAEQVSVMTCRNVVISFQERKGDVFESIRDRLRHGKGRIRQMGADYLAYSLVDAVVDNYFVILEWLGDRIEQMEDTVVDHATSETAADIHQMKRQMLFIRKAVWPMREVVSRLDRNDSPLIEDATAPYYRDVYDHVVQVIDAVETYRDLVGGLRDTYLAVVSNRMNEIMKVLTIIATIFIPITFIAGIYGMNFEGMPELKWRFGYPMALMAMAAVAAGMLVYFRRRRWL
jgi:magnesium transporter